MRTYRRARRLAVALAALAISATVAGCQSDATPSQSNIKNWDGYNAEYLSEQKNLILPSGVIWPRRGLAPPTSEGTKNNFEDGVGRGEADALWYCAWERRWLTDFADKIKASADLEMMRKLTGTGKFKKSTLPGDRHIYTDAWSRAELGDPSLIQQDVTVNCRGVGEPARR
jgi:hypothetical protein